MKTHKFSAFLLGALMLTACQSNGLTPDPNEETQVTPIIINATMPDADPSTRIILEPQEDSKDFTAKFKNYETVQIFFVQGETIVNYGLAFVRDVTADGHQGVIALALGVPDGIDKTKEYTIYGMLGDFRMRPKIVDNKLMMNLFSYNGADISKFNPPVIFKTVNPGNLLSLDAEFEHVGAYEVVHLKNSTSEMITAFCQLVDATAKYVTRSWAYDLLIDPNKESLQAHAWDLVSGDKSSIVDVTRGGPLNQSPYIQPGEIGLCFSWYVPRENVEQVPESRLVLKNDNNPYVGTNTALPARKQLVPGRAYHVFAEYTDDGLFFRKESEIYDMGDGSVESVSLDKATLTVKEGRTATLVATIKPKNAINKEVTWSSSDTSIVTVDSNGLVTGVKAGVATITVTTTDGNKTATCTVTVKAAGDDDGGVIDPIPGENFIQ